VRERESDAVVSAEISLSFCCFTIKAQLRQLLIKAERDDDGRIYCVLCSLVLKIHTLSQSEREHDYVAANQPARAHLEAADLINETSAQCF
jgi:hypothetical protein